MQELPECIELSLALSLPYELLLTIFDLLDLNSQMAFSLACKQFLEVSEDEYIWRQRLTDFFGKQPIKNKTETRNYKQIYTENYVLVKKLVKKFRDELSIPMAPLDDITWKELDEESSFTMSVDLYKYISFKSSQLKKILDQASSLYSVIQMYLKQKGDPNYVVRDTDGHAGPSLCYFIVLVGDIDCLQLLIDYGMNLDGNQNYYRPIYFVAKTENEDCDVLDILLTYQISLLTFNDFIKLLNSAIYALNQKSVTLILQHILRLYFHDCLENNYHDQIDKILRVFSKLRKLYCYQYFKNEDSLYAASSEQLLKNIQYYPYHFFNKIIRFRAICRLLLNYLRLIHFDPETQAISSGKRFFKKLWQYRHSATLQIDYNDKDFSFTEEQYNALLEERKNLVHGHIIFQNPSHYNNQCQKVSFASPLKLVKDFVKPDHPYPVILVQTDEALTPPQLFLAPYINICQELYCLIIACPNFDVFYSDEVDFNLHIAKYLILPEEFTIATEDALSWLTKMVSEHIAWLRRVATREKLAESDIWLWEPNPIENISRFLSISEFNMNENLDYEGELWRQRISELLDEDFKKDENETRSYKTIFRTKYYQATKLAEDFEYSLNHHSWSNTEVHYEILPPKNYDSEKIIPHVFIFKSFIESKALELKKILMCGPTSYSVIKCYLELGGDPNYIIRNPNVSYIGPSLCYLMTCVGDIKCLELLFKNGMKANGNHDLYRPINLVIETRINSALEFDESTRLNILKILIHYGAEFDWQNGYATPIVYAIRSLKPSILKFLFELGANPNPDFLYSIKLTHCLQRELSKVGEVADFIFNCSPHKLLESNLTESSIFCILKLKLIIKLLLKYGTEMSMDDSLSVFHKFMRDPYNPFINETFDSSTEQEALVFAAERYFLKTCTQYPGHIDGNDSDKNIIYWQARKNEFSLKQLRETNDHIPILFLYTSEIKKKLSQKDHGDLVRSMISLSGKIPCFAILCSDYSIFSKEDIEDYVVKILIADRSQLRQLTQYPLVKQVLAKMNKEALINGVHYIWKWTKDNGWSLSKNHQMTFFKLNQFEEFGIQNKQGNNYLQADTATPIVNDCVPALELNK